MPFFYVLVKRLCWMLLNASSVMWPGVIGGLGLMRPLPGSPAVVGPTWCVFRWIKLRSAPVPHKHTFHQTYVGLFSDI